MNRPTALVLAGLCILGLVAGAAAGGVGSGPPIGIVMADDHSDDGNETPRHQHPDDERDDGDLDALEGWLTGFLGDSLTDGAIELSEGEYDLARSLLGDEYDDRWGQYVSVAGETDGERADDEFREVQQTQQELIDRVEEFYRLWEEYQAAIEAGDEERARDLARQLDALADEIDEHSEETLAYYEILEDRKGVDFSEAKAAITEANEETQIDRDAVVGESLVETSVTVDVEDRAVSFLDPVNASGSVHDEAGEPIADATVRLELGPDTVVTTTDETGAFSVELRPTMAPLDTDHVTAHHEPGSGTPYLGSSDTAGVEIEQVEPTVTVDVEPETLVFGETLTATGTIAVAGEEVDDVPLELTVGAQSLGAFPAVDGAYTAAVSFPAAVPDGHQQVTVAFTEEDVALAPASASVDVTVEETATTLSVDGQVEDGELVVSGVLETTDGDPVPDQSIVLTVDGMTLGDVTTDGDGAFETTLAVPDDADDEVTVGASFDGGGTNLAVADAQTIVSVPESGAASPGGNGITDGIPSATELVSSQWSWLLGLVGVLAVMLIGWILRRQDGWPTPWTDRDTDAVSGVERAPQEDAPAADSGDPGFLERAREAISSDPNAAVALGYAAVRRRLQHDRHEDALTHWEFYRARATEDSTELLRAVTERYEQAVFSTTGVTAEEATEAIRAAERLGE